MSKFPKGRGKPSPFNGRTEEEVGPVNADSLPPIFSFEYMANGGGYSVDCCDIDHKAALVSRLYKLSRMTWLDIRQAPRHGLGSEKIARNAIKPPIPARVTEDVDFLALRYNGLHPMIGFRDGRTFNVMYIDHSMDVYPHG